jgi:hypothetical protein
MQLLYFIYHWFTSIYFIEKRNSSFPSNYILLSYLAVLLRHKEINLFKKKNLIYY